MSNTNNTNKTKLTINDLIKLPVRKIFPSDPSKLAWTTDPVMTAAEQKVKQRALYGSLKGVERRRKVAEWEDAETNFVIEKPTVEAIEEATELINDLNSRGRDSYDSRRIMIVLALAGDQSEEDIDDVRFASGLSPEKLKQAITTGTTRDDNGTVLSNGVPAEGIQQSTVAYLNRLIQQGKDEAKHRRDVAAMNKATKSRAEFADLEASF
jgi:hypothetical protein